MSEPERQTWVSEAQPEQQGSFCDTQSGHEYHNHSNFESQVEIRAAESRGYEPIVLDDTADPDDNYSPDQRFNHYHSERDGQGTYHPAKHGPGR